MGLLLDLRRENGGSRQNLIEVLELLSGFMLIRVRDALAIDLGYVGEPVDDERSKQDGV